MHEQAIREAEGEEEEDSPPKEPRDEDEAEERKSREGNVVMTTESAEESEGVEAQADAEEFARRAAAFNSIYGLLTESVGRAKQRF